MLVAVKILRNVVPGVSRSRCNDRIEALKPGCAIAPHVRLAVEELDHRHRRLLRARSERPRRSRTAEQRDELAALHFRGHSITSSARSRNDSGILRWRAFA